MSQNSNIEWTDCTWPVVRGCSKVSDGCKFCWAIKDAHLHAGNKNPKMQEHFQGLTVIENGRPNWTGVVRLDESILEWPLRWKTPRRIFATSSGDLFHENLPDEAIWRIFGVMARCPQHTFQVLTKRARRMREWMGRYQIGSMKSGFGPPANVWLGVSVENQPTADERIPELLRTPAALQFVSFEPALEEVDFRPWLSPGPQRNGRGGYSGREAGIEPLGWSIIGGESGPNARPFNLEWARYTIRQFKAAGVPLFVKQLGAHPVQTAHCCLQTRYPTSDSKGGKMSEWPEDLRVREFPK